CARQGNRADAAGRAGTPAPKMPGRSRKFVLPSSPPSCLSGEVSMTTTATPGSVTALLERVKAGDHEAVRLLWQRYYPRLVGLARKKLQAAPLRVADEEDAALSAFNSFCRRAEQGQFPDLKDRDGLW